MYIQVCYNKKDSNKKGREYHYGKYKQAKYNSTRYC